MGMERGCQQNSLAGGYLDKALELIEHPGDSGLCTRTAWLSVMLLEMVTPPGAGTRTARARGHSDDDDIPAARAGWVSVLLLEWLRRPAQPPGSDDEGVQTFRPTSSTVQCIVR